MSKQRLADQKCRRCSVRLIVGENQTEARANHTDHICSPCNRQRRLAHPSRAPVSAKPAEGWSAARVAAYEARIARQEEKAAEDRRLTAERQARWEAKVSARLQRKAEQEREDAERAARVAIKRAGWEAKRRAQEKAEREADLTGFYMGPLGALTSSLPAEVLAVLDEPVEVTTIDLRTGKQVSAEKPKANGSAKSSRPLQSA